MLTYAQCVELYHTAHGSAVEGNEIEIFSRAYMRDLLMQQVYSASAELARNGGYDPMAEWQAWQHIADRVELAYSAPALAPGMPGFKPATHHNIDKDGRQMAALYMERRWRAEMFKHAGIPIPAELAADCDPEEV